MPNKTALTISIDFGDKIVPYRLVQVEPEDDALPETIIERSGPDAFGDTRWVSAAEDSWALVVAHVAISYLMRHSVAIGSQTTIGRIKYDPTSKGYHLHLELPEAPR